MKKLIFFLLLGQFCLGQVDYNKSNSLTMDNEVVPIIEEFIKEGEERGFYLRFFLIEIIDSISFSYKLQSGDKLGTLSSDYRNVYLSPELKSNKILLKITVFHEIGHAVKNNGNHTCYNCHDIMSEYSEIDLKPYSNLTFWEYKLDEYFKWLNGK